MRGWRAGEVLEALASAFAIAAASCGGSASPSRIEPPGPVTRVVSVIPSITEMLFGIGAGDLVVGVSEYADWPPGEVEARAVVGSYLSPNIETIASLHPDLVLVGDWENYRALPALRRLSIRVEAVPDPATVEEIVANLRLVGNLVGRPEGAEVEAARLMGILRRVRASVERFRTVPRIYLEVHYPDCWTVGPGSYLHALLEVLGGRNIFEDLSKDYDRVTEEAVVARDPEIILTLESTVDEVLARPAWQGVTAVRRRFILTDDPKAPVAHPSQRLGPALDRLQRDILPMLEALEATRPGPDRVETAPGDPAHGNAR